MTYHPMTCPVCGTNFVSQADKAPCPKCGRAVSKTARTGRLSK